MLLSNVISKQMEKDAICCKENFHEVQQEMSSTDRIV